MNHKFSKRSLNAKLLFAFIALSIIPLLIAVIIIYNSADRGFVELKAKEQEETEKAVKLNFSKVSEELLSVTKDYAIQPDIIAAFHSGDREQLATIMKPIYERLHKEHKIDVVEFGENSGNVFFRAHKPKEYGENKLDRPAIQATLKGNEIAGFEFGSSGLSVRALAPITYNNEVIGTLQTAIDDGFLKDITDSIKGVNIDLYNQEGAVMVSSDEKHINNQLNESNILEKVLSGEEVINNHENYIESFIPMYDPTKEEIIGFIGITRDFTIISNIKEQVLKISIICSAITLIVIIPFSIWFSRRISKPIVNVSEAMGELADGNLNVNFEKSNRNDEVGQLDESLISLKSNLLQIIQAVSYASDHVAKQSDHLTEASEEVRNGSEQIAMTMQELATGSEVQANHASNLSEEMTHFNQNVLAANQRGNEIAETSRTVLEMANEGSTLMVRSVTQMVSINGMMEDAVDKMEALDKQSEDISSLVHFIRDISEQTNLLSLNAAIEAARVGEHGKGFAVVAEEVRKLSDQVSASVDQISTIFGSFQTESKGLVQALRLGYQEVDKGTDQIKLTGETFKVIQDSVTEMANKIEYISSNLVDIAERSKNMSRSTEEIAAISEESAASIEEVAASSEETNSSMQEVSQNAKSLKGLAGELEEQINKFKI